MDNLIKEMEWHGVSVADLAVLLGCTEKAVRGKLEQTEDFTYLEAEKIHLTFFPSLRMEYLFAVSRERAYRSL